MGGCVVHVNFELWCISLGQGPKSAQFQRLPDMLQKRKKHFLGHCLINKELPMYEAIPVEEGDQEDFLAVPRMLRDLIPVLPLLEPLEVAKPGFWLLEVKPSLIS